MSIGWLSKKRMKYKGPTLLKIGVQGRQGKLINCLKTWLKLCISFSLLLDGASDMGHGWLIALRSEHCLEHTYRGELLGLMTLHLLLLSFNGTWWNLPRSVSIYSDCTWALDKVEQLPPHQIQSKCKHAGILRNISCNGWSAERDGQNQIGICVLTRERGPSDSAGLSSLLE